MKWGAMIFALIALVAAVWYITQPKVSDANGPQPSRAALPDGALAVVKIPAAFSPKEQLGKRAFDATCSKCHGDNAQGRDGTAPPLVHKIYEPSHHGDMAFELAAKTGVRSHHWKFGDMPPVEGVTRADVLNIVAYNRALQRENGIN